MDFVVGFKFFILIFESLLKNRNEETKLLPINE